MEDRLQFIRNRESETIDRYKQMQLGESNKKTKQMLLELQKENSTLKEQLFEVNIGVSGFHVQFYSFFLLKLWLLNFLLQCQNEMENLKKNEKNEINRVISEMELLKEDKQANLQLVESLKNELSEKSEELRKLEMEQTKLLNVTKRVKVLSLFHYSM